MIVLDPGRLRGRGAGDPESSHSLTGAKGDSASSRPEAAMPDILGT
jgi:hypothetical protein